MAALEKIEDGIYRATEGNSLNIPLSGFTGSSSLSIIQIAANKTAPAATNKQNQYGVYHYNGDLQSTASKLGGYLTTSGVSASITASASSLAVAIDFDAGFDNTVYWVFALVVGNQFAGLIVFAPSEFDYTSLVIPLYAKIHDGLDVPMHIANSNVYYGANFSGVQSATFDVVGFNLNPSDVEGAESVEGGDFGLSIVVTDAQALQRLMIFNANWWLWITNA